MDGHSDLLLTVSSEDRPHDTINQDDIKLSCQLLDRFDGCLKTAQRCIEITHELRSGICLKKLSTTKAAAGP